MNTARLALKSSTTLKGASQPERKVPLILISSDDDKSCCNSRTRTLIVSALSFGISVTTAVLSALLLLNFTVVDAELLLVTGLLVWDATGIAVAFILVAGIFEERKVAMHLIC